MLRFLGWVLLADLVNKANLATSHVSPVFTWALLNFQELMGNTQGIKLSLKLSGVTPVILVRGIEAADHYIAVTHA